MRRRYVLVVALVALLGLPGTSVAADASRQPGMAVAAHHEPLQRGAGYAQTRGAPAVRALQQRLRTLAWRPGPVDGLYGPRTEAAVTRLQAAAGLPVDGIVGPATRGALRRAQRPALRRGDGYAHPAGSSRVRALQRRLHDLGWRPGPIDGLFGPRTEAAVTRLQRAAGLPADGVVKPSTRSALAGTSAVRADKPRKAAGERKPAATPRPRHDQPTPIAEGRQVDGGPGLPLLLFGAALALMVGALGATALSRRRPRARERPVRPTAAVERPLAARTERIASEGRTRVPRAEAPRAEVPTPGNGAELPARNGVRALGYVSVREAHRLEGPELDAQLTAIDDLCERRGWKLVEFVRDVEGPNGKGLERPGLSYALTQIARGEATCLVVSQLERLSRSAAELGRILESVARSRARFVAIDLDIDTAGHSGRVAANALISVSGWERERLAERTRKGLAAARAKGAPISRPAVQDVPELKHWIAAMRAEGLTLQAIADRLNEERVPTLRGGERWRPSSVQAAAGYRRPRRAAPSADGSDEGALE